MKNESPHWQPCKVIETPQEFLDAVRRVRNNLFHGGKSPNGPMNDRLRNEQLIKASTRVLEMLLAECSNIKDEFEADG